MYVYNKEVSRGNRVFSNHRNHIFFLDVNFVYGWRPGGATISDCHQYSENWLFWDQISSWTRCSVCRPDCFASVAGYNTPHSHPSTLCERNHRHSINWGEGWKPGGKWEVVLPPHFYGSCQLLRYVQESDQSPLGKAIFVSSWKLPPHKSTLWSSRLMYYFLFAVLCILHYAGNTFACREYETVHFQTKNVN